MTDNYDYSTLIASILNVKLTGTQEFSQTDRFDTDLFSGHGGKGDNSKKPAYRDSNGFPVRPDERTPGTPGGSKAGFTAFERSEDGGT